MMNFFKFPVKCIGGCQGFYKEEELRGGKCPECIKTEKKIAQYEQDLEEIYNRIVETSDFQESSPCDKIAMFINHFPKLDPQPVRPVFSDNFTCCIDTGIASDAYYEFAKQMRKYEEAIRQWRAMRDQHSKNIRDIDRMIRKYIARECLGYSQTKTDRIIDYILVSFGYVLFDHAYMVYEKCRDMKGLIIDE